MLLPPLFVGILEFWHPTLTLTTIFDDVSPVLDRWMLVHTLQLIAFGGVALAVFVALAGQRGWQANLARLAMGCFALFYGAFDVLAGLAPGFVMRQAQSGAAGLDRGTLAATTEYLLRTAELGAGAWLKNIGEVSWFIGMIATAFVLLNGRRLWLGWGLALLAILGLMFFGLLSWVGLLAVACVIAAVVLNAQPHWLMLPTGLLLAVAAVSLTSGHLPPYGPLTFECLALALLWRFVLEPQQRPAR